MSCSGVFGGDVSDIKGDVSHIFGDASNIWGDVSNLYGNVSHISGYVENIEGDSGYGPGREIHGSDSSAGAGEGPSCGVEIQKSI